MRGQLRPSKRPRRQPAAGNPAQRTERGRKYLKTFKKLLSIALLTALLLAIAVPAFAAKLPEEETVYLLSTDGSHSWWFYHIGIMDSTNKTKVASLKSSKKAVCSIVGINRYCSEYTYLTGEDEDEAYSDTSIMIRPLKAGKANITAKIDGVANTMKLTVKKYVNPVKSFVITGISSKNLKSKFAKSGYCRDELTKNAKKGNLKITAASGWEITEVSWRNETNGLTYSQWLRTPKASFTLAIPAMKATEDYEIEVYFRNKTDGASLTVDYNLINLDD